MKFIMLVLLFLFIYYKKMNGILLLRAHIVGRTLYPKKVTASVH